MSKVISAVLTSEYLQYDTQDLVAKEYIISSINEYIDKKRAPVVKLYKKLVTGIKGSKKPSTICISKQLINHIYGLVSSHSEIFIDINPELGPIISDLVQLQGETDIFSSEPSDLNKSQDGIAASLQNLMTESIMRKQSEQPVRPKPTSPFVVFSLDRIESIDKEFETMEARSKKRY